jgi:hypothetical protein
MILPDKYIKPQNSILNLGGILLNSLGNGQTVTLLWEKAKQSPDIKNFERFTLALDFLFTLGLVDFEEGLVVRVKE